MPCFPTSTLLKFPILNWKRLNMIDIPSVSDPLKAHPCRELLGRNPTIHGIHFQVKPLTNQLNLEQKKKETTRRKVDYFSEFWVFQLYQITFLCVFLSMVPVDTLRYCADNMTGPREGCDQLLLLSEALFSGALLS